MTSLNNELVFLILQFLDAEKFKDTVHNLELESGVYFNMGYFEEIVTNGEWDKAEKYLAGFITVDDNRHSLRTFFELRKQRYLEALDRKDRVKALDILVNDLRVFAGFNEYLYKEMIRLLVLDDFRQHEELSMYTDTKSARKTMLAELKKLLVANPLVCDKLQFPNLKNARLVALINQSLNWQHHLCKNPRPSPDMKTLFVDHSCDQPNGAQAPLPVTNPLMGGVPRGTGFPVIGTHGPFQPTPGQLPSYYTGWMANPSSITNPLASTGFMNLAAPNNPAIAKRPRTPTINPALDNQIANSEHVLKRQRPVGLSDDASSIPINVLPDGYSGSGQSQSHAYNPLLIDVVPKSVVMALNQGSFVNSMDFHPLQQSILLVGTNSGDITIWDIASRKKMVERNFEIWNLGACSIALQESFTADNTISSNRVVWSPDGLLFGVAYSRNIVHIYSHNGDGLRNHLEIEAHTGSVNDLAFSYPNKQLSIVTCGDDKTIKVWDASTGAKLFCLEGHEAPVYSVCPHYKNNIQFLFSTATDGKIKAWLYDNSGPRVDYDAPGHSSTKMAYSTNGKRLFSCGTNREGESHLVEWDDKKGEVRRSYHGLGKRSLGIVQFDSAKNQILAAGNESVIKFWDMDRADVLTTTDADGGLPASPCLRFSKEGILLAASTNDNGIKVLANGDGVKFLQAMDHRDPSRAISVAATTAKTENHGNLRVAEEVIGSSIGSRVWKLSEVNEASQCRSLRLPDNVSKIRIARLIYTNSGAGILALAVNGVHKLWRWSRNVGDLTRKATASLVPEIKPSDGMLMTNGKSDTNPEDEISCFALSKNDSYLMSASGGKISLFNLMNLKAMATFKPPPPAATYFAFHPQDNNVIAIGMDDSSIQIYNVRVDEVKAKLTGHKKRITGLAFSNGLNVLVSSGADSQLCVWSIDDWKKKESKYLQMPPGRVASPLADTRVQFHQDQIHVLAVHETQIAIYSATNLECLKQWVPREVSGAITHATYSCDSQSIFVCFQDGSVDVLTASTLRLRCRINPTAYAPPTPNAKVYPVVIAAHPSEPNQFALGLTDGGVVIIEPNESEGMWGTVPSVENVTGTNSSPTAVARVDQQPQL